MRRIDLNQKEDVKIEDIGMYLRLIQMDFQPDTDDELADLICQQFNVNCTAQDIRIYEQLHIEYEDYEKVSRMVENGNIEHLIE